MSITSAEFSNLISAASAELVIANEALDRAAQFVLDAGGNEAAVTNALDRATECDMWLRATLRALVESRSADPMRL